MHPRVVVCLVVCACLASADTTINLESGIEHPFQEFYIKLYKVLNRQGNFMFSPDSVEIALGLSYEASDGSTQDVIQRVLYPYGRTFQPLTNRHKYTIGSLRNHIEGVANSNFNYSMIFASDHFTLNSTYIDNIKKTYGTDVNSTNFTDKTNTVTEINNWFHLYSEQVFNNMVTENDLDPAACLLVCTVMDITRDWRWPFNISDTKKQTFYLNDKDTKQVDMMHMTNQELDVHEDKTLDAKVLVLYCLDKDVMVLFWIPNQRNKLEDLKRKLFKIKTPVTDYIKRARTRKVNLAIPRFNIRSMLNLKDSYNKLGLGEIFSNNAKFPGLVPVNDVTNKLFVTNVTHETYLHCDETGLEGAGATAQKFSKMNKITRSAEEPATDFLSTKDMRLPRQSPSLSDEISNDPPLDLVIDHPFLVFVTVATTGQGEMHLIAGQVCNP